MGNYGFVDQRNALEGVNEHIRDFGADPANLTLFGVSAGSISIHLHLLAEQALFDRAIMMSGAAPALSPLRPEIYQRDWERLCERTGVKAPTAAERLDQLRSLSVDDILKSSTPAAMGPVADRWAPSRIASCSS